MKIALTADTRPRIASEGNTWTNVLRTTMLTLSNAPVSASMARDKMKFCENPNTIVASPNPATDQSSARPARRSGGRCAMRQRHHQCPQRRRRPQPAQPARADL